MESKKRSKREREEREDEMGIRKGPWTAEEDSILVNYISTQGEGRWNFVAKSAGLKRTGKSCRLRWVNYLRPDVRRGNITLQEQILIIDLHSRWGNRWSKIAQHLPGRTDNEIKNYWRTRVMKQAKYLNCDVNTQPFRDAMRYVWLPRLLERIRPPPPIYPPPPSPLPTHHCLSPISDFLFTRPDTSAENGSAVGFTNQDQALYLEQGNTSAINTHTFGHALDGFWNDHNIWFLPQHL